MGVTAEYGSFSMGGRPYLIDGPVTVDYAPDQSSISFRVVVVADGPTDLASKSQALEDAFVLRYQDLTIEFDNGEQWTHKHSDNTGLNTTPFAIKEGDPVDTGKSRAYQCGVSFQLPTDDTHPEGAAGRLEAVMEVSQDTSHNLHADIRAVYTASATPEKSGLENAKDNFPDFVDTQLALFPGWTWDERVYKYEWDDQNKICTANATTRTLPFNETQAQLNDTRIIDAKIAFARSQVGPGDTPSNRGTERLETIVATYSCGVDVEQTKDLEGLFESTIKPHMNAVVRTTFKARYLAITNIDPRFIKDENRIEASITYQVAARSSVWTYEASQRMNIPTGRIWIARMKGDPYERYEYQGPIDVTRTTNIIMLRAGNEPLDNVAGFGTVAIPSGTQRAPSVPADVDSNWRLIMYDYTARPTKVGVVRNPMIPMTREEYAITEQYVNPVRQGAITQGGSA